MVRLGSGGLEQQLKVLAGAAWHSELASEEGRPPGSPSVLLLSASAAWANDLIKQLPNLHRVDARHPLPRVHSRARAW